MENDVEGDVRVRMTVAVSMLPKAIVLKCGRLISHSAHRCSGR